MSIPEASNEYFSSDMHTSSWLAFSVLSFSIDFIRFTMFVCFTIVPFGFPVEPDVYIIYATDSGKMLDVSSWTFGVFSMAVSYTHLDVYKRQAIHSIEAVK